MIDYLLSTSLLVTKFMTEEEIVFNHCSAVQEMDVLCGRGKLQNAHPGNKKLRELINRSLITYGDDKQTKTGRAIIVRSIIDCIHSLGGHFLQWDKKGQYWVEMTDKQRRDKIAHAIRDANKLAMDEANHHHHASPRSLVVGCHRRRRHHHNNNGDDRSRSPLEERDAEYYGIHGRLDQHLVTSPNSAFSYADAVCDHLNASSQQLRSNHSNVPYSHCHYEACTEFFDNISMASDKPITDLNNVINDSNAEDRIKYDASHILLRSKSRILRDHVCTIPTDPTSCNTLIESDNDTFLKFIEWTLGDIDDHHDYSNIDALIPYY